MEEFKKLGLSEATIKALEKKGFEKPTPIQRLTIPLLIKGKKDIIGKAQTGTGKTACFALPIIEQVSARDKHVQALILAPTRELALQVSKEIESLQGEKQLRVLAVYGGTSIRNQLDALKRGVQIVVGTPGRIKDLINRKRLHLDNLSFAVLDEADEMLNMGFVDDIKDILSYSNEDKKMLFFSATMPREILKIAKTFMKDFEVVEVEAEQVTAKNTKQLYYNIKARDRLKALHRVIDITPGFHGIVFCKTKRMVDEVASKLAGADYGAAALHGDVSQSQREKILGLFRKRIVKVLVATDVAARGIDVNDLTHVINFSLPQSAESYVHRIGRTGRAGKQGIAITFLIPSEKSKIRHIERIVKQKITREELPSIKEVLEIRKDSLKAKLSEIVLDKRTKRYTELSDELLEMEEPKQVVASLIKFIFKSEMGSNKYSEIDAVSDIQSFSDRGGDRGRGRGGGRDRGRGRGGDRGRDRGRSRGSDRGGRGGDRGRSRDDRPRERRDRGAPRSSSRSSDDRPRERRSSFSGSRSSDDRPRERRSSFSGSRSSDDRPSERKGSSEGRSRGGRPRDKYKTRR
jgi:ATP-dependent RNA helicase DeaD